MTDLTLYTIADQYLQDIQKLQDMDLDEQTFADTLESLSGDLEVKATNVAMFVRNLEASAESIKAAEKQMAERRKAIEAKAERIRLGAPNNWPTKNASARTLRSKGLKTLRCKPARCSSGSTA